MKMTLGEMLKRFRLEKNIEASDICAGICTKSTIAYFEKGIREPDTFEFERLVERMGVSPEHFAIVVTNEEYQYRMWKESVFEAIDNSKWTELGVLLEESIATKNSCNSKFVKQFYNLANGIYMAKEKGKYDNAVKSLELAIHETIPNIIEVLESKTILGASELYMLILYFYYCAKGKIYDAAKRKELFEHLNMYIRKGRLQNEEKAKFYPKLICIACEVMRDDIDVEKLYEMCQYALEMLRQDKSFYDITPLLKNCIELCEKSDENKLCFYKKQYETFADILNNGGGEIVFQPEYFLMLSPKCYMIQEYLYSKRKEKNLTQEVLSEGICEPETYSRVERGKRAPSRKNYYALTERLDIHWHYYRGEIDTNDINAFVLRRKYRGLLIEGKYEESLQVLHELESILDMENIINYQSIKTNECMLEFFLGKITEEEAYLRYEKLLAMTKDLNLETKNLVYYSQTELEIIADMALKLAEMERLSDGIKLLETVLLQITKSEVQLHNQWNGIGFALQMLADLYFKDGRYEKANEILYYLYKIDVKLRIGANFPTILDYIADNLEHIDKRYSDEYKKLYRQSYYVSDFYYIMHVKQIMNDYYTSSFDANILWYD